MRCSSGRGASVEKYSSTARAAALPVAVVVDDQHAAVAEQRVEVAQLVQGRLVPVGVEPQQGEPLGRRLGQRLLDRPGDESQALGRVAGLEQRRADRRLAVGLAVEEQLPGRGPPTAPRPRRAGDS